MNAAKADVNAPAAKFDAVRRVIFADVDLAVFGVIFSLHTDLIRADQTTAMLNASRLVVSRLTDNDSDLRA